VLLSGRNSTLTKSRQLAVGMSGLKLPVMLIKDTIKKPNNSSEWF